MKQITNFSPVNSIDNWINIIDNVQEEDLNISYKELKKRYSYQTGSIIPSDIKDVGIYSFIYELKQFGINHAKKVLKAIDELEINYLTFLPNSMPITDYIAARTILKDQERFYTDGLFSPSKDPRIHDFFVRQMIGSNYAIISNQELRRSDITINTFGISEEYFPSKEELNENPTYQQITKNPNFYQLIRKK
jgi:hypothetical protein